MLPISTVVRDDAIPASTLDPPMVPPITIIAKHVVVVIMVTTSQSNQLVTCTSRWSSESVQSNQSS